MRSRTEPGALAPRLVAPGVGFEDSMSTLRPAFLEDSASRAAFAGRTAIAGAPPILATPGGAWIGLDRPVVIGRAPRVAAVAELDRAPRIVRIVSGGPAVSRTHVRIDPAGSSVVVTDLASKNGTSYTMPGRPSVRLRAGEQAKVGAGTVIDLGGGVRFTVGERG